MGRHRVRSNGSLMTKECHCFGGQLIVPRSSSSLFSSFFNAYTHTRSFETQRRLGSLPSGRCSNRIGLCSDRMRLRTTSPTQTMSANGKMSCGQENDSPRGNDRRKKHQEFFSGGVHGP